MKIQSIRRYATAVGVCAILAVAGAGTSGFSSAIAQEAAAPASIKAALAAQVGKRAKLRLVSGQEIEGKVQSVGAEVISISELTGMEFYGATVRVDQIAAVITRIDGR